MRDWILVYLRDSKNVRPFVLAVNSIIGVTTGHDNQHSCIHLVNGDPIQVLGKVTDILRRMQEPLLLSHIPEGLDQ